MIEYSGIFLDRKIWQAFFGGLINNLKVCGSTHKSWLQTHTLNNQFLVYFSC